MSEFKAGDWYQIQSAPAEGTEVDVWAVYIDGGEGARFPDACRKDGLWYDVFGDCINDFATPTHWSPKPEPPK